MRVSSSDISPNAIFLESHPSNTRRPPCGQRRAQHFPPALRAAASYIEHEWEQQGYAVRRLAYNVSRVRWLNLEITRSDGVRQREIVLIEHKMPARR
jgi:hypothetical protein